MPKVRLKARQARASNLRKGEAAFKGRSGDSCVPPDSRTPPPAASPLSDALSSPPHYRRTLYNAEDIHLGSTLGPGQTEAGGLSRIERGKMYTNAAIADRLDMYPDRHFDVISHEVRQRRTRDAMDILATNNIACATVSPMWLSTRIRLLHRAIARAEQGGAITRACGDGIKQCVSDWATSQPLLRADPEGEDEHQIAIHAMDISDFVRRLPNTQLRARLTFYPDYHSGVVGSHVAILRWADAVHLLHNTPLPPPPSIEWLDERRALYDIVLRRAHERGSSEDEKLFDEAAIDGWYENMKASFLQGEVSLERFDDAQFQTYTAMLPAALLAPLAIKEPETQCASAGNQLQAAPLLVELPESERKARAVRALLNLPKRVSFDRANPKFGL